MPIETSARVALFELIVRAEDERALAQVACNLFAQSYAVAALLLPDAAGGDPVLGLAAPGPELQRSLREWIDRWQAAPRPARADLERTIEPLCVPGLPSTAALAVLPLWVDDVKDAGALVLGHADGALLEREADLHEELAGGLAKGLSALRARLQAAHESQSLARFVEENPSPILRMGPAGELLQANASARSLLSEATFDTLSGAAGRALESGQKSEVEVACGAQVFVFTAVPFFEAGYVNFYGQDVTAVRRANEELRRSEELLCQSQKLEAVGRLAGGVAHDFNNLLTAILCTCELMRREAGEGSALRADVEEIAKAANRATDLTRQLLAFGRKQVMQPRRLDLNALVGGMERMLSRLLGDEIALSLQRAPGLGLVLADPGQLERVLLNLVINARDAMPKGGCLRISTGVMRLEAERHELRLPAGDYVTLEVADTGCGMSAETRARVFEPYFTTKPLDHGTGLGLPLVYGIVTQSGGAVCVESEPGQGTRIRICLPRVGDRAPGPVPD